MEYNEIRTLLNRYWEGETSLEDEDLLRSFFAENQHNLPADLQEAAPLFGYFAAEISRDLPALPETDTPQPIVVSMPRPWQHWMKYAAVLLMAAGLTYSVQQFKAKQDKDKTTLAFNQEDTFNDPDKAYAATKKALELLAKNLNKGTAQVQKLSYFNEATEMIKAN